MRFAIILAVSAGFLVVAASILFIDRYQISAIGYGYGYANGGAAEDRNPRDVDEEVVFRLDRWTGRIDECLVSGLTPERTVKIDCGITASPMPMTQRPQTGEEFFGNSAH